MAGEVTLIAKIAPKNDAFTGLVDAKHVIGGVSNTLPDTTVSLSNVAQHITVENPILYSTETGVFSLNLDTTYFDVDSSGQLTFIYDFDLNYLRLDGANNLVGADSWLKQSVGDARYLMVDTGTVLDVSSIIYVTELGLSWSNIDSYTIIKVQGFGGPVIVMATPSIAQSPNDGQEIIILGMDDTNTVTFQDGSKLAGSGLSLSNGQNMTLGKGDTLHLIYEATLDNWVEVSRSNNIYSAPIVEYLLDEDGERLQFEDGNYIEEE